MAWRRAGSGQGRLLVLLTLGVCAAAPAAEQPPDPVAAAERLLASGRQREGALALRARLVEREGAVPLDTGRLPVELEARLALAPGAARLRLTLVMLPVDGEAEVWQDERVSSRDAQARHWLLRAAVELPEDVAEAALLVEDLDGGAWGMARAELGGASLAGGQRLVVDPPLPALDSAASGAPAELSAIRIVPPREHPAAGRVRLHALAGSRDVARVVFLVDGAEAASDERQPYSQVVDLGEAAPHELGAVAFAADGRELGRDRRWVNAAPRSFDLALRTEQTERGRLAIATVSVPAERRLASVEFFRNEEPLARLERPPFEALLPPGEAGPSDYLRVLATLDDGSTIDDVVMLAGEGLVERLDVNLVQVFAVVTDRQGTPIRDLEAEDFELRRGASGSRQPVAIERFAYADDLPLTLGLVFDSSGSMDALMPDAKQAGATFLARAVRQGDRAFLVDFDDRPRLAEPATGDRRRLLLSFGGLEAGGNTALYDAILFAMLQFEQGPGRRALVVLTDGEDYGSELSAHRAAEQARRYGVPVYVIDLSGVADPTRNFPKLDLQAIAEATGGRLYMTASVERLEGAYAEILAELRSQYLLAFSTERTLSPAELGAIDVEVKEKGLRVRRVVGGS